MQRVEWSGSGCPILFRVQWSIILITINHHYQLQIILYLSATTYTNGVVLTKFYSHIRPVKGGEYSEAESRKSDQNPHLEWGGAYGWRISFSEFVFPATLLEHVGLLVGPSCFGCNLYFNLGLDT